MGRTTEARNTATPSQITQIRLLDTDRLGHTDPPSDVMVPIRSHTCFGEKNAAHMPIR